MKLFQVVRREHTVLVIGSATSLLLLIMFLVFQQKGAAVLGLESRWLFVTGVPLLAALFAGGYIKSFKGFGVELEANLKKPIATLKLSATEALTEIHGDEKQSIGYLNMLDEAEKNKIGRLALIQGKSGYYSPSALQVYFGELRSLKYVEIRTTAGAFVALLPATLFKQESEFGYESLRELIQAVETSEVLERYSGSAVTRRVNEDADLITVLKQMRKHRVSKIVVTDSSEKFVGLLTARTVEKRIAETVLQAKENA